MDLCASRPRCLAGGRPLDGRVRRHVDSAPMNSSGVTCAWRSTLANVPTFNSGCSGTTQPTDLRRKTT